MACSLTITRMKISLLVLLLGLSAAAGAQTVREVPPQGHYCLGNERVDYRIAGGDVVFRHGNKEYRGPTAYSWFGREQPPKGFVIALLVGGPGKEALLFDDRLEWNGRTWKPCPAAAR